MRGARKALVTLWTVAAIAAPSAALADQAGEAMLRGFVAGLDASLDWDASAATIASDGGDTVVSGLAILQTDSHFRLSARSIRFTGLKAGETGGFFAARITIEGGFAGLPEFGVTTPKLIADEFATPGLGGWRLDAARPASSISALLTRLAATEFTGLSFPSAEIAFSDGPPGAAESTILTATIANLDYGPMKAGKLGGMSLGKVEVAAVSRAGPLTARFEGMSAEILDPGAFARLLDPAAYSGAGDGEWRVLAQAIAYGALTVSLGPTRLAALDGLEISGLEGRQPDASPAALLDRLMAENPSLDGDKTVDFLLAHGRSLTGWLKLGNLTLRPASLTPLGGMEVSQKGFEIEDLSPDGLGRIALRDFVFAPAGFQLRAGNAEIADVAWPDQVALLTVAKRLNVSHRFGELSEAERDDFWAKVPAMLPQIGAVAFENVAAGEAPSMVAFRSFKLKAEGPRLGPIPAVGEMSLDDLTVPGAMVQSILGVDLALFGYGELTIGAAVSGTFNAAEDRLQRHASLTVKDAGTLIFDGALTGVDEAALRGLAKTAVKQMLGFLEPGDDAVMLPTGLAVAEARLRYTDNSFAQRIIDAEAKRRGTGKETILADIERDAPNTFSGWGLVSYREPFANAIVSFFNAPKSLTLTLSPPEPVPLALLLWIRPEAMDVALATLAAKLTAND